MYFHKTKIWWWFMFFLRLRLHCNDSLAIRTHNNQINFSLQINFQKESGSSFQLDLCFWSISSCLFSLWYVSELLTRSKGISISHQENEMKRLKGKVKSEFELWTRFRKASKPLWINSYTSEWIDFCCSSNCSSEWDLHGQWRSFLDLSVKMLYQRKVGTLLTFWTCSKESTFSSFSCANVTSLKLSSKEK